jgi:type I restriction enzyme, S subunit
MEIPLPDVTEQQKISKLLATLDSRIVNLQNQNQTLEKIAQTLFKQWFVDFNFPDENGKPYKDNGGEMVGSELGEIPKGWKVGVLGEIAYFKNGKTSPERTEKNVIPVYGSNGIIGKTIKYNFEHTVIIGRVGSYCGSLYYCMGKCWVTDNAMIGKLKKINSHVFLV